MLMESKCLLIIRERLELTLVERSSNRSRKGSSWLEVGGSSLANARVDGSGVESIDITGSGVESISVILGLISW